LGLPRSSHYAARRPRPPTARVPQALPRALTVAEQAAVRDTLNSERFVDQAAREVYATLLDEGQYLCSVPTMYRILQANGEVQERRNQRRHPPRPKPTLVVTGPNQAWSWDITKLLGPLTGLYFYLYVLLDLFSRFVVGWLVAEQERATTAEQLITEACVRQLIARKQLVLHSDLGAPMTAKSMQQLLLDLGVTQSLSRPRLPDDNPYSEAQFKTTKYHSTFPGRFDTLLDTRRWAQSFFAWYNYAHHHTGLGLMTPAAVHTGQALQLNQQRQIILAQAYAAHPERFVNGCPQPPAMPSEVWLNRPKPSDPHRPDTPH
jgi:putative transposase